MGVLVIVADDYGYCAAYDAGILEAARAGAIDAAGAMVLRDCDPGPLLGSGVAIGLHLESLNEVDLAEQLRRFEALFGAPPAYLDGHHHCHAAPQVEAPVIEAALRLEIPVRGVDHAHRLELRDRGVRTADRLIGRLSERDPAISDQLRALLAGEVAEGVTEWFVHPGHPDPSAGSTYDAGRGEDLELLLALGDRDRWAQRGVRRVSLRRALGSSSCDAAFAPEEPRRSARPVTPRGRWRARRDR